MPEENNSRVSEFIFLGFAHQPELKIPISTLLLLIYIVTVVGNLGLVLLIRMNPQLHTPMYFFLSNLSFLDICYSSNITPKVLENFLSQRKTISFIGCMVQMYFFVALASTECILLGLMAYDRYAAICSPLLYTSIMSHSRCIKMASGAFAAGFLISATNTAMISTLSFCQSNKIDHFFCEIPSLLKLLCSDIFAAETLAFICAGTVLLGPLLVILSSYTYILSTVLKINVHESQKKAFSTCFSHLSAVTIFYGTGLFVYLQPSSNYSEGQHKIMSLFYSFGIPMLNPFIYSLRNKEVKDTLKRVWEKDFLLSYILNYRSNSCLLLVISLKSSIYCVYSESDPELRKSQTTSAVFNIT
ncbi:olfactory receptor 5F1-like [Sceloporus undulatus]|uniref:olfactory receptor 5F1-like n=1 Tax=Sceloporus undulatus TaxID=8520 RepID=UPI001C4D25C6|nr:olfactory receptor 5F1-like [Sceloporus undulatus]